MTERPFANCWSRIRTSFFWMFVIAFGLRILTILVLHTYKFRTSESNFGFGWEMGRIAESLARGYGFSNPFHSVTGPTAWEPPLTPFLIAGVFKLFGIYTRFSAFTLLTINSFWSALTCIPIFLIARRCFSERVAVGSAWTWALMPYVIYWCTKWVWETSLSALLIATIFWLAITFEERKGWRPWAAFGLLWGVAALNSPVLLSFLPASGLYAWYRRSKAGKKSLAGVVLASLLFFACIAPWLVRNYHVFGRPVFIRSNFGAELRMGNGPNANGTWMFFLHPTQNTLEAAKYERMGELAYVESRKQEALAWIKSHPGRFLIVCMERFTYYWYGVPKSYDNPWVAPFKEALFFTTSILMIWGIGRALRRRKPHAWLFLWLLLCYPAVYYLVFPHARYRHPIDPEITILAVFLINEADRKEVASR
ncbi:MAG TPA: glycosyltransferase family 39 protein [Terriglobales bacterium]|jgi:4-amino-4-deoxy-L-arabinose transferase-like glycosyltransferase|nr:glycosyltransferase family 39 protein [Terriglobales bacterium]